MLTTNGQVYNYSAVDVRTWLEMLYGDAEGKIHISSTGNWGGRVFNLADMDDLLAYVDTLSQAVNVSGIYFRVTTLATDPPAGERGGEKDSFYLPGLWSDLDVAGPGHKTSKPLPPSEQEARRVIEASGLPEPTLWIKTGGGLHPYWLLYRPEQIQDVERVKRLSVAWQKIIAHSAKQLGYFVDGTAVSDLARIMRLPGTWNRKTGEPKQCTYADGGSADYFSLEGLEQIALRLVAPIEAAEAAQRPESAPRPLPLNEDDLLPGQDWARKTQWADILAPAGWKYMYTHGGRDYWQRPGKAGRECSATVGHEQDVLFVFSTSTEFEAQQSYTKFGAYTALHHGGDYSAATRALRAQGFGAQTSLAEREMKILREIAPEAPTTPPPISPTAVPSVKPPPRRSYTWDDTGNAHRIKDYFGSRFRYVAERRDWSAWDGKTWRTDTSKKVSQAAEACTEVMIEQADEMEQLAQTDQDHKKVESFRRHIRKSRSSGGISSAVTRFSEQQGISLGVEEFDQSETLLAQDGGRFRKARLVTVQNGVLDLLTGELLPHNPEYLLTRIMNASYDPQAQAPQWNKFLAEVLPDESVRKYLQRAMGYTLLGEMNQRAMFLLYGPSGTGKSQFIEAIANILGDFATTAASATFRKKHGNSSATNDLHGLKGKRLISSSETSETSELDEELLKRFTGRDQVTSRDLYEKNQTWTPEGAVWLTTNFLPKLSSDDNAVWLRIKPIKFEQVFAGTEGDVPDVAMKIVKSEAAGILNWLLEGVREYLEVGLQEPAQIVQNTTDHRRESDNVAQFLEESGDLGMVVHTEGQTVRVSLLYSRYEHWCKENRVVPLGIRRFNQRCISLGLRKEKVLRYYQWLDLQLNDAYGLLGTMT